jgi:C1A family cysteine protease
MVTGVRNQGLCGSSYAFSAIGMIESLARIYYRRDIDLS